MKANLFFHGTQLKTTDIYYQISQIAKLKANGNPWILVSGTGYTTTDEVCCTDSTKGFQNAHTICALNL